MIAANRKSVIEALKILAQFSFFSGIKPNKEKREVAGIDVKKGVKVAICGIKNIDVEKIQRKFSEFIILPTKNLKMNRISKTIYRKYRLF